MKPTKFKLEIELGNDAMQDQTDIATSLKKIASDLMCKRFFGEEVVPEKQNIFDRNGNRVGFWRVV
jgi:hypothetical protein